MIVADMDNVVQAMCAYMDAANELAANIEADVKSKGRTISSGTVLALSKLISVGGRLDKVLSVIEKKGNQAH